MCTSCTGTAAIDPKILLRDLILQLPNDYWWMVHPKEEDDVGLHKALGVRRVDIDTLLVKAGMYTRSSIGKMLFKKDKWATYKQQYLNEDEGSPILHGDVSDRTFYVANSSRIYPTPSKQDGELPRGLPSTILPDTLKTRLKELTKDFDKQMKEVERAKRKELEEAKKKELDAKKAEEKEMKKRTTHLVVMMKMRRSYGGLQRYIMRRTFC